MENIIIKTNDNKIIYYPISILANKCLTIRNMISIINNDNKTIILDFSHRQISNFISLIESENIDNTSKYRTINEYRQYLISIFKVCNFMEYDNISSLYVTKKEIIHKLMTKIYKLDQSLKIYEYYKQLVIINRKNYRYINNQYNLVFESYESLKYLFDCLDTKYELNIQNKYNFDYDIEWSDIVNILQMDFDISIDIVHTFIVYIIYGPYSYYENNHINNNIKELYDYIYYKFNDYL